MKRYILWDFERGTPTYDLFCLLIIAFIFLTPKPWFDTGKERATLPAAEVVKAQDFSRA